MTPPGDITPMVVYTCITDDYDWLLPPLFTRADVRYICFTDRPRILSRGWEIRSIDPSLRGLPPNLISRRYKFLPWDYLPRHEYSLWVDGRVRIRQDPRELVMSSQDSAVQLFIPRHSLREHVWQEFEACVRFGKIGGSAAEAAADRLAEYAAEGFADDGGLAESGIIFRRGDGIAIRPAMQAWFEELSHFAGRDQISLPYVVWKFGVPVKLLDNSACRSRPDPYFAIVQHKNEDRSLVGYLTAKRFHGTTWKLLCLTLARPFIALRRRRTTMTPGRRSFRRLGRWASAARGASTSSTVSHPRP